MKKNLITLLFVAMNIFNAQEPIVEIVNYETKHLADLTRIAFEDPDNLFANYTPYERDNFIQKFQLGLTNPYVIRVILEDGKTVGYIRFCLKTEICLTSIRQMFIKIGQTPPDDDVLLQENPCLMYHLAGECQQYVSIEGISIDKAFRRKGYGRKLIRYTMQLIYPIQHLVMQIKLEVHRDNIKAIKLYESEGFIISEEESMLKHHADYFKKANIVRYEKYI